MIDIKKHAQSIVAEVDATELTLRMIEAMIDTPRQAGLTNAQVAAQIDPVLFAGVRRAAEAAMGYVAECLNGAEMVQ